MKGRMTFAVLAACLGLATSGCGGGGTATVTGTVKYKGAPLTAGSVTLQVAGKRPATGPINADGTYRVENAPVGNATILVQTPLPASDSNAPLTGPMPEGAVVVKVVPIPKRFADPAQSNLSAVITPGGQQHHITLND